MSKEEDATRSAFDEISYEASTLQQAGQYEYGEQLKSLGRIATISAAALPEMVTFMREMEAPWAYIAECLETDEETARARYEQK